ncbi:MULTISPECIES: AMP-dependent synthetase/ligase [unclassified Streptomyces]|uniref:AMP-dependent synthetase/ligase n=1 Tax=unclassified Streptomyces TaxID=2593676 RepID=UPI0038024A23
MPVPLPVPDSVPPLVEPVKRWEDGVVREVSVPPLARPVRRGSLAGIPFDNAREAPDAVVISRKRPGAGPAAKSAPSRGRSGGRVGGRSRNDRNGGSGSGAEWQDITATAFADEVLAVAKGLIAEGLRPGDRLAIMSRTTYEWTLLDFAAWAAGLVTVPIYPTSSAFQVRWILQDSGAVACVVEDGIQARLISQERERLPGLTRLWTVEKGAVDSLCAAGREVQDAEVTVRRAALGPDSVATISYTSGTTGRPKGCVLTHGNFFAEVDNAIELLHPVFKAPGQARYAPATTPADRADPADGSASAPVTSLTPSTPSDASGTLSTLLFLPLSHVFGRMVAIGCLRARVRLGHAPSIRTEDLLADLAGFRPTFLLAIPYVLEKVYNTGRATAERMGRGASFDRAARIAQAYGAAVEAAGHGEGPGPSFGLRALRALYEPLVYRRIRAALGGRVKYVICGGSPLGRRLAAFYSGAGVVTFEGYGLTETTAASTVTPPLKPRLGTVGWPMPGTSVRIADDGEVLLRGGHVFAGYWDAERGEAVRTLEPDQGSGPGSGSGPGPADERDGWFATGDLGSLDEGGYLTITGRKKDVIITSSGKNIVPAPLEDWLRAHPLVSQCLVVGDNRPYAGALITLEPEGLAHWRMMRGKQGAPLAALVHDKELRAALQRAIDEANRLVSRAESIRRFRVLEGDFTEAAGHLTPTLKLRRAAIAEDFAAEIAELYA